MTPINHKTITKKQWIELMEEFMLVHSDNGGEFHDLYGETYDLTGVRTWRKWINDDMRKYNEAK